MLKIYRTSLIASLLFVAVVAFAAPTFGQSDAGSFEELLDLDLAPLETSPAPLESLPYLADPEEIQIAPSAPPSFSIAPLEEPELSPQQTETRSVLEVPHLALDPVDSEELVLPDDLRGPTPENTLADRVPAVAPCLHAPQPLPYSRNVPLTRQSLPLRIEFYSVRQVSPYAYRSTVRRSPSGYRPYGGYQPYGGYGGYRGSLSPRSARGPGPGCSGRR